MRNRQLSSSHFHFIGIGGIGMSGLAELLHNMGARITGSDLGKNAQIEHLKSLGIRIYNKHVAENVEADQVNVIVYSSAIPEDNPEILEGRRLGIPLIQRAEALAEIMLLRRGVAIAGTHGKTTTTSLVASVFLQAKFKPTIAVGGRLDLIQSTAQLGEGEWMVVEADESDGSFSRLSPELVVITNIDSDHMEYYKNFSALKKAFYDFALRVPFYGSVIVCGDDPVVHEVFQNFPKKLWTYGFGEGNDYVLRGEGGQYEVHFQGKTLGPLCVPLPGRHNALNALAAVISGLEAGIDFEVASQGVRAFDGVDRRFQFLGTEGGVDFYDDYGHHPTEIKAVMQAFSEKYPERRCVVLFQPHRISRTRDCWQDFVEVLAEIKDLYLLDIYRAGESSMDGVSSQQLCWEVGDHCQYMASKESAVEKLVQSLKPGDVFVTLGAGDVWECNAEVRKQYGGKS